MGKSWSNRRKGILPVLTAGRGWRIFLVAACLSMVFCLALQHSVFAAGFTSAGNMTTDRKNHTSTTLADGRVLITGGTTSSNSYLSSAEIYDPATGLFTPTGGMTAARAFHTATRLQNGKVLITGGLSTPSTYLSSAEVYDPASGTFDPTGSMDTARAYHTATLLIDDTVLVAGGQSGAGAFLASARIYNPATGIFTPSNGSLSIGRRYHSATPLNDAQGRVLFAGGEKAGSPTTTNTAEIYTPAAGTFSLVTATMPLPRKNHTAVLLNDGRVLLAGGYNGSTLLQSAEIFDPAGAGAFSATASMASRRANHTATRLPSGKVLIAGGDSSFIPPAISAVVELFDPAAGGSFAAAGTMSSSRTNHSATLLSSGTVMISGGNDLSSTLLSAEIYDPGVIKVSPVAHAFPDTNVLEQSGPQSFTITNSGTADITLDSIGFSGTDGTMFTLDTASCGNLPRTLAAGGNCSVSVTFAPTSAGLKSASLDIGSTDPEKPVVTATLSGTGLAVVGMQPVITILFDGLGGGSTTSSQAGLTCLSSDIGVPCEAQVEAGTVVSVAASGDKDSLFAGWSEPCSGTGVCTATVNSDMVVIATFNYVEPARLNGAYFLSLQDAYTVAIAGEDNVIEAREYDFPGPVEFKEDVRATLKGGYDLNYSPDPSASSVIVGNLSISKGLISVQRIIVRSPPEGV